MAAVGAATAIELQTVNGRDLREIGRDGRVCDLSLVEKMGLIKEGEAKAIVIDNKKCVCVCVFRWEIYMYIRKKGLWGNPLRGRRKLGNEFVFVTQT